MNSLLYRVLDIVLTNSGRLGRLVVLVASVQLLVGLYFLRLPIAMNAIAGVAQQPLHDASLRFIYPSLPNFWIPESFAGFAFAVVFLMTGAVLIGIDRIINSALRT